MTPSFEIANILSIAFDVIKVILLFSITIFVHELGHFIAARVFGMRIEVFSIGIGPAMFKYKRNDIVYKIGWIPFGGYVALPQMDPNLASQGASETARNQKTDSPSDTPTETATVENNHPALTPATPFGKIVVALSGALGNMVLAFILAWMIYVVGKPASPAESSTVVGFVDDDSAAHVAGIRTGDEIIAVNGYSVHNWFEMMQENAKHQVVSLNVRTDTNTWTARVPTQKSAMGINMVSGLHSRTICRVQAVEPDSSAAAAGVLAGDIILKLDSVKVLSIEHLIALTAARTDQRTELIVDRRGTQLQLQVVPKMDSALGRARIGLQFDPMALDSEQVVHIPPGVQIRSHAGAILRVVSSLLSPSEAKATSQGLGGPFMIIYMLFDMVRRGLIIALWFTCFLNVNLAILNLLPIPILDGGHVIFSLVEGIFRRPLHPKIINGLSQLFAILLIAAFIMLSGRDVLRIGRLWKSSRPAPDATTVSNDVPQMENAPVE